MKQLKLYIQDEAVKIENVINFKRTQRNELIDAKKKAKKEKDIEAVEEYSRQLAMTEDDIITLETKFKECEREFDILSHKLGKIRLDCYIFADIIYNTLLEYEEFLRKYVVNKQGDSDMTNALTTAINNIKLLPFEMANGGYTNELYCQVTEKFMERWKTIRDGVIQEVLREVDDEYIEEQKRRRNG